MVMVHALIKQKQQNELLNCSSCLWGRKRGGVEACKDKACCVLFRLTDNCAMLLFIKKYFAQWKYVSCFLINILLTKSLLTTLNWIALCYFSV